MMRQSDSPLEPDSDVPDAMHPTISEEVQDLIMSSDGEAIGNYNPPPRIASRIYKSSANRRKSSAPSSRRNSITSHHSSRSARSAHGGPQSTHIAQHLRRASIIESRKAKAANRNAHAETVRERAAKNKSLPRVTAYSEERAIAAQQARERLLAQVKASCAEEVKRSKRVAEEQREKRAAEHIKMKEEMEERYAEAEKRKILLQHSHRRPRTATLPSIEEPNAEKQRRAYVWKPNSEIKAARIIQQAWKDRQRRVVISEFLQLGLTVEAVQMRSFEEVGELLSQDQVLSTTARLLNLFDLKDETDDNAQDKAAVRTFLSTFLVLGHPAQVFSKEGEQEKDLISKAQNILTQLNAVLDIPAIQKASLASAQLEDLTEAYSTFQAAFAAWRSHDQSFMISGMVAQFVELDAIWQTVKNDSDGEVAADYREGIQQNMALVLVRLKRLAGADKALKMIRHAVKTRRRAKTKQKPTVDKKPRIAPDVPGDSDTSSIAALDAMSARKSDPQPMTTEKSGVRAKLDESSLVPDNRTITHELAINKKWKIDVDHQETMRDSIVQSTTRKLQQCLDAGLAQIAIPAMAESISLKLLKMLPPEKPFHTLVLETLDSEFIARQIENNSFSYQKFFSFMSSILPKLCAPVRDEEVKGLTNNPSDDPVEQLARISFVIELMVMDGLNFMLMRAAPALLKEAPGYESRAFAKRLSGTFPDKTLRWWKDAIVRVQEEAARRGAEASNLAANRVTPNKIYMTGLVELAITTSDQEADHVPETLELDQARFTRIHNHILRIITTSSILITAKNLLRRDVRSLWKAEAQRMWDLPFSSTPATFVSIVESRYALPPTTKQQLTGTITRLLADAREGQANHPVLKVLLKKIKTHVFTRLSASSSEERIRASTTATEVLGSGGMPEFVSKIGDIVQELGRVADVDREAHGDWYDQIAQRATAGAV